MSIRVQNETGVEFVGDLLRFGGMGFRVTTFIGENPDGSPREEIVIEKVSDQARCTVHARSTTNVNVNALPNTVGGHVIGGGNFLWLSGQTDPDQNGIQVVSRIPHPSGTGLPGAGQYYLVKCEQLTDLTFSSKALFIRVLEGTYKDRFFRLSADDGPLEISDPGFNWMVADLDDFLLETDPDDSNALERLFDSGAALCTLYRRQKYKLGRTPQLKRKLTWQGLATMHTRNNTEIQVPAGCHGAHALFADTTPDAQGGWIALKGLFLNYMGSPTDEEDCHGIIIDTPANVEDCTIQDFPGHGYHSVASGSNCCHVKNVEVFWSGRSGFYIAGADGNASTYDGINLMACGRRLFGVVKARFPYRFTNPTGSDIPITLGRQVVEDKQWHMFYETVDAPVVTKIGTGPAVTVHGNPAAAMNCVIEITLDGGWGTGEFRWSKDGGATWVAEGVLLPRDGTHYLGQELTASFVARVHIAGTTHTWTSNAARVIPAHGTLDVHVQGGIKRYGSLEAALVIARPNDFLGAGTQFGVGTEYNQPIANDINNIVYSDEGLKTLGVTGTNPTGPSVLATDGDAHGIWDDAFLGNFWTGLHSTAPGVRHYLCLKGGGSKFEGYCETGNFGYVIAPNIATGGLWADPPGMQSSGFLRDTSGTRISPFLIRTFGPSRVVIRHGRNKTDEIFAVTSNATSNELKFMGKLAGGRGDKGSGFTINGRQLLDFTYSEDINRGIAAVLPEGVIVGNPGFRINSAGNTLGGNPPPTSPSEASYTVGVTYSVGDEWKNPNAATAGGWTYRCKTKTLVAGSNPAKYTLAWERVAFVEASIPPTTSPGPDGAHYDVGQPWINKAAFAFRAPGTNGPTDPGQVAQPWLYRCRAKVLRVGSSPPVYDLDWEKKIDA